MFALTSSQIASTVQLAAPKIGPSHDLRDEFKAVSHFAGLERLLPTKDPLEQEVSSHGSVGDAGDREDEPDIDSLTPTEAAKTMAATIKTWPVPCPNAVRFQTKLSQGEISVAVVREMLSLISCKAVRSDAANETKLMSWVASPPCLCPFLHMNKAQPLKHPLHKRLALPSTTKVEEMRAALAEAKATLL